MKNSKKLHGEIHAMPGMLGMLSHAASLTEWPDWFFETKI